MILARQPKDIGFGGMVNGYLISLRKGTSHIRSIQDPFLVRGRHLRYWCKEYKSEMYASR